MGVRTRDMVPRGSPRSFQVAACNTDKTGVSRVARQPLAIVGKRVEQSAECGRDRLLARQTIERGALTGSGVGITSRHVGRLISSQDITVPAWRSNR